MNILLINHYAGSPVHGMEYRPFYFAREWVRMGHNVTIVAASFSHVRTTNPAFRGISGSSEIDGVRYLWLWTPGYWGNGIARGLNITAFLLQLFARRRSLAKACEGGAVIASSTYPMDVIPANSIARLAGARLIFEVHDLWPLSPTELGKMSRRHPFIQVTQRAENFAYRIADHVVSMLPLAEPYMRVHGLHRKRFTYVPNGIDTKEWSEDIAPLSDPHRGEIARLRSTNSFLVGYAGSHGLANALESVVKAAELLKDTSATFVFVGQGPEKRRLQALAADLGVKNVVFLPPVSKAAIPSLLSAMDCLIISWQSIPLYRFGTSPNKLFDYMMAERPIIQAIGPSNDIVAESGCGVSVPPEDSPSVAAAVLKLMNISPAERDAMGRRGRQYVEENHEFRCLAKQFADVLYKSDFEPESSERIWCQTDRGLRIILAEPSHLNALVAIHLMAFRGFFLESLGSAFLKELYRGFIAERSGVCLVAFDGTDVVGFVAGTTQAEGFFRLLLWKRWPLFLIAGAPAMVLRPIRVGKKFWSALRYRGEKPADVANAALLSSIGVAPGQMGKGVGRVLLSAFCDYARACGSLTVFLTTDRDKNDATNRFYLSNRFELHSSFLREKGRWMNLYTRSLGALRQGEGERRSPDTSSGRESV